MGPSALDFPLQELEVSGIEMTLEGVILPLNAAAEKAFERITADSIKYAVVETLGSESIYTLEVKVTYLPPTSRILLGMIRKITSSMASVATLSRMLAQDTLVFDTLIQIRSVLETHDAERYIGTAFNDEMEQHVFLESLRATGQLAFANVTSMSISLGTAEPATQPRSESRAGDTANMSSRKKTVVAVVVPVLVATAVGLGLVAFFVVSKRKKQRIQENPLGAPPEDFLVTDIASEIEIGAGVDMSSLGDPVHNETKGPLHDRCMSSSSVSGLSDAISLDYEYKKELGSGKNSSLVDSSVDPITLESKDDKTLEAEYLQHSLLPSFFESDAPPGTLGLMLETSKDGNPIVCMIKDTSPLFGQVQVGDLLISVDGIDVTGMWATDICQLLASKKKQMRTFLFARPPPGWTAQEVKADERDT